MDLFNGDVLTGQGSANLDVSCSALPFLWVATLYTESFTLCHRHFLNQSSSGATPPSPLFRWFFPSKVTGDAATRSLSSPGPVTPVTLCRSEAPRQHEQVADAHA